jgi:hypothetical protein
MRNLDFKYFIIIIIIIISSSSSSVVIITIVIALQPFVGLGSYFSLLILYKSGGLHGRGISPSRYLCLYTGNASRINAYRHLCLEWDSNP